MTTDQIAEVWPTAEELGFPSEESCFGLQFGHGLGVGLYEAPMISRLHSFDDPVEIEEGMVFALETYCPAGDGRSAARIEEEVARHRRRLRDPHAVPGRASCSSCGRTYVAAPTSLETRARGRRASDATEMPGAAAATRPAATELCLGLYRRMLLIRRFEEHVQSLFQKGEVHGTTHLYSGQEAVAVGVAQRARATTTASPAPTAATATRSRSASSRRGCSTSCSAARPASAAAAPAR